MIISTERGKGRFDVRVKLYQLELDQSMVNCGMSYVFQLCDNSFFLIDGGYFTPGESDRLFAFLKERSENETPVIRGWLFTHAHQDHIGCFMDFVAGHLKDVVIEKLYFNFQLIDLSLAKGDPRKKSNDLATVREFYEILKRYCRQIPVVTLKTGDRFQIGELSMEVLYTADDILPLDVSFNDYSCVVRITVGSQRILFLGDVQQEGSRRLLDHNKEKLRAEIVQVSHHGFNGASEALYQAVQAEIALFPCPDYEFEKNKNSAVNSFLREAEECYVSGRGTCELRFPYEPKSAKVFEKQFFDRTKQPFFKRLFKRLRIR